MSLDRKFRYPETIHEPSHLLEALILASFPQQMIKARITLQSRHHLQRHHLIQGAPDTLMSLHMAMPTHLLRFVHCLCPTNYQHAPSLKKQRTHLFQLPIISASSFGNRFIKLSLLLHGSKLLFKFSRSWILAQASFTSALLAHSSKLNLIFTTPGLPKPLGGVSPGSVTNV